MKTARSNTVASRFIVGLTEAGLREIPALAETAWFGRNISTLTRIASLDLGPLSRFYQAICLNWTGRRDQAEEAVKELLRAGPAGLQAKALLVLAGNRWQQDPGGALELYEKAQRLATEPTTALTALKMKAVIASSPNGDHRRSLDYLEIAARLLRSIPQGPAFFDFLNAVAVELVETGAYDQARRLAAIASSSPWSGAFPEWRETASDERLIIRPPSVAVRVPALNTARLIAFPQRETPETPEERIVVKRLKVRKIADESEQEATLDGIIAYAAADEETQRGCSRLLASPFLAPPSKLLALVRDP